MGLGNREQLSIGKLPNRGRNGLSLTDVLRNLFGAVGGVEVVVEFRMEHDSLRSNLRDITDEHEHPLPGDLAPLRLDLRRDPLNESRLLLRIGIRVDGRLGLERGADGQLIQRHGSFLVGGCAGA